ncbi:hypothetical protein N431DRAFT_388147 [Stipitochalara longipes BDJ]|nr:hypothetical protein N431DRAFT_388147 [Stipitochalara longipes BDJ]
MVTTQIPNQRCIKRPRRSHHKSRNGCFECKRRRVKCDELRPSCARCTLLLGKCSYLLELQSTANAQRDGLSLPSSQCSILYPSPNALSSSERSPSFFEAPMSASVPHVDVNRYSTASKDPKGLTDTDLYNHYLQHTSCTLTLCERDRGALQIEIPKLALQNRTVFHSLLAVSAACLCHDMISKEPAPDTNAVNQVLMAGYEHYNLASEQIRELISSPCSLTPEPLLASAVLLVPFATASQQINHWISSRSETKESLKLLSTTPRDPIIIMRAIRTMLQTLHCDSSSSTHEVSQEMELAIDSASAEITIPPAALAPSRTYVMFPILAATIQRAFVQLQQCLDSAPLNRSEDPEGVLSACSTAFEILKYISSKTFLTSNIASISSLINPVEEPFKPKLVPLPQVAPWLRSFARRATDPLPTEPLTSFLLSFLVQAPQAYLDFVLPLLDQRLESPIGATSDEMTTKLTREQALALDIYAHWSVLMLLAEEDSWWIGSLPVVTLTGMVNRYGDDFVTKLWLGTTSGQELWWPGSMLSIYREIKRHR